MSKKSGNDDINKITDETSKVKSYKISNQLDVRGQKLCVISFVKDDSVIPQFLFQVYAFFEKEDECNAYIRNVCGDKVQDFDIDVVSTCQWIFPQQMTYDKVNKEIFRSDELDRIMSSHRNQPKEVARFKESIGEIDDEGIQANNDQILNDDEKIEEKAENIEKKEKINEEKKNINE